MIEKRLLARIEQLKAELDSLRPLAPATLAKLKQLLDLEWTYNSNAIEGSTLSLRETQLILEHGATIGGKSLREHFEVVNHKAAIEFVENLSQRGANISAADIRLLHALVLANIADEKAGRYREVAVRITGALHVPPEAWQVPILMDDLVKWMRSRVARGLHPIERATIAHHTFVAIHPFIDGNGRTGRLLMNVLLLRDDFPPAVIEKANRRQYYSVLREADAGRTTGLINLVARACEKSLRMYVEAARVSVRRPARADRWMSLRPAALGTPYSQEYLSLLARTGKLRARKLGRNWQTTRNAIAEYTRSKRA